MARVMHYRVHSIAESAIESVEQRFEDLANMRNWRGQPPWVATSRSRTLFEMEYFRHARIADGDDVGAAGFMKMAGDETDALVLGFFLRDLSAEHQVRVMLRDDANPIAKLRYLEFRDGRLPLGSILEDTLAKRPVIKKVQGQSITFYPPSYRVHSLAPRTENRWGYALLGMRAYAASLVEAEFEALKIMRGLGHLGR